MLKVKYYQLLNNWDKNWEGPEGSSPRELQSEKQPSSQGLSLWKG